ncbi:ABC transporter ATP-binding protein [Amycolatopsis endophytica]|uniref:ABC-type multidrug transport system fused ATPase/permease subunit n=1 Tax=Amycolatopsis endophytica TaxID=860233 RepID=A0A853B0P8_9PSEU|nr:ABC transporter ATP-binding protein [Amycolatopsis endophytica]NYI88643.1 ABC-type multidrug transport system fused ATPase/permease subunit [Amycolatopsis endophytica]
MRLPSRLTPLRFLGALLRARPWLAVSACGLGALWLLPGALLPLVIGTIVDDIRAGEPLLGGIGLVVLLGVAQAVCAGALIFAVHTMWIHGAAMTQKLVVEHTARLGASLRSQAGTGDVMAVSSSDINHIGNVFEVTGRLFGSLVAFLTVSLVLIGMSPLLGTIALVGVPLATLSMGRLVAPLQRTKEAQREELSSVNALAADIASGLRILRGVGGEQQFLARFRDASQRVRRAGVEVARNESWLTGAEVLLPGLVTVAITWLGARFVAAGTIGVGELVAFYTASVFLVVPVSTATEFTDAFASATVSAKKVCGLLNLRPLLPEPEVPVSLPDGPLELHDTRSGFTAVAGKLTVVDFGADAEALAERLARFTDDGRVLVSGVPADHVALAELRSRVVYAHNQDVWFSGVLRDQLVPAERAEVALRAADAEDIVEGLPGGLDELIGERGREVSGGQRQRLNLARALALDADTLLLDEPTSAVDAHTEARITGRVAELRHGRTTVVFTESPLWKAVADEVITCG